MHKKLFGLLATAAVGLTLTSCGGGGGGGGSSDTPTDTEDTPVVEVGAPASLAKRKLVCLYASGNQDVYEFVDGVAVVNTYTQKGLLEDETDVYTGTYKYSVVGNMAVLNIDMETGISDVELELTFEDGEMVSWVSRTGLNFLNVTLD